MTTTNDSHSLTFSEALAEALRSGDDTAFNNGTPLSAALLPLLRALGWKNFSRELIEALPHFSNHFDIVNFRNVMVSLGYESQAQKTAKPSNISTQLYPCLYVANNGRVLLLLECCGDRIRYFDTINCQERIGWPPPVGRGTAYTFTDTQIAKTISNQRIRGNWSQELLQRFRSLVIHLLSMTFLINLVALAVPLAMMLIYDKVIGTRSLDTLPFLLAGVSIALMVDFGLRQLRARLLGNIAGRIDYLIGVETFKHLLYMPPLFTERSSVAVQLSRLKQFDSVRDFLTGSGISALLELPFAIISIIVIAFIAGPLAWVPLITLLAYLLLGSLLASPLNENQKRHGLAKSDKHRSMLQTLEGRTEIKGSGTETTWLERFREISGENAHSGFKASLIHAAAVAAGQLIMGLSALTVITWGTFMVMASNLSIGGLIAIMALVWRILNPMQSAYLNITQGRHIIKALQQIDQLMKIEVEPHDSHSVHLLTDVKGQVTVDRVAFRYGPDQDPTVLGASFVADPGELIVITGATGSGKSTLLKLIAGMYQPQAGTIAIDDIDIRQIGASELRRNMAYVPQNVTMFHGTITQNLRLNNALATYEDLERALKEAGVFNEVMALAEGLDTRIGDNVTKQFPPGFIRGLALARALVRPAPILLLDEPGASLDMESDQIFMNNLRRMRGQRTVIMVSHRPSHIKLADRAVFMQQGAIKFVGDPAKVVAHLLEQAT